MGGRADLVLVTGDPPDTWGDLSGYRAVLTTRSAAEIAAREVPVPAVHSVGEIEHLQPGDIVGLTPRTGQVRTLYRPASKNNTLFARMARYSTASSNSP